MVPVRLFLERSLQISMLTEKLKGSTNRINRSDKEPKVEGIVPEILFPNICL